MSLKQMFKGLFDHPTEWAGASGVVMSSVATAAKPRLAAVRRAPTKEEFAAWRDEPVTRFVMAALMRNAEECREQWLLISWEGGEADQRTLDGLRERSDALLGFTSSYEAFCETLGLKGEEDDAA